MKPRIKLNTQQELTNYSTKYQTNQIQPLKIKTRSALQIYTLHNQSYKFNHKKSTQSIARIQKQITELGFQKVKTRTNSKFTNSETNHRNQKRVQETKLTRRDLTMESLFGRVC